MKKKRKPLLLGMIAILFITTITGCTASYAPRQITGFYFDTVITVTIYHAENPENTDAILNDCMQIAAKYDQLFSKTEKNSDIYKINHAEGKPVSVSPETVSLLQDAVYYAKATNGLVDPTIGSVSQLWDFHTEQKHSVPSERALQNALLHVDYHALSINPSEVTLQDPEAALDLGFLAKGYIADKLKEYLLSREVDSAIINLGGNVLAVGQKTANTPFQIGIQKPFASAGTPLLTIPVCDSSVVSSGSYWRYFEKDGTIYHHILSTSDGYPVNSGLTQVTILNHSSAEGDALSTICFLLGYEKAVSFLDQFSDVGAVFVTDQGEILYYHYN